MDASILHAAALSAALPLSPLLAWQGQRVRRTIPRLPEAAGPRAGVAGVPTGATIRLLLVGESTVAGVGAGTHGATLGAQTARALAGARGGAVRWQALGRSGVTARDALALVRATPRADAVVIALGVNDTLRLTSPRAFRRDVDALVRALRRAEGDVPVLLAGVPPVGRFPALPQPLRAVLGLQAEALDRALAALARRRNLLVHAKVAFDGDRALVAGDGFHPSPLGYAVWGVALAAALAAALERPPLHGRATTPATCAHR
jgi:lysophospholipase L1-like esterase